MKEKLSQFIKFILVLLIAQSFTNCAVEDLSTRTNNQENVSLSNAKNWFENYKSATAFKPEFNDLNFDWANSKIEILENDLQAVVVPVSSPEKNQEPNTKKYLYFYPAENASFHTTLYELKSSKETLETEGRSQALSYFNGYINVYNLEKGFVESTKFENSIAIATFTSQEIPRTESLNTFGKREIDPPAASYCLGDVILCNDYQSGGGSFYGTGYVYFVNDYSSIGTSYAGSYFNYGHGSGAAGGGAGSGNTNTPDLTDDSPPSCQSFNFVRKAGSDWQESLVKNIRFKIVLIDSKGAEMIHSVIYPQAISFGAPALTKNNVEYKPGVAADVAAKSVKESMQDVVDKYGRLKVSEMVIDQYFRERLVYNYGMNMYGGRIQFNSTSSTPATEYKTTLLWSDDCILD